MTQDAGREGELEMVTLFSSSNVDAEMEANNIHTMLQASGIPSVVIGSSVIPSLEFQVQVPAENADEAQRIIDEAQAAGPQGAADAEAAGEEQ
jgi:uridine phosphorylase